MKQVAIAIAVAAVASVAVCATSQATPIAPVPAAVTTGTDHLVAYMYNGQPMRTAGMGIIKIIGTGAMAGTITDNRQRWVVNLAGRLLHAPDGENDDVRHAG